MRHDNDIAPDAERELDQFPTFELEYLVDEQQHPTELTIFPESTQFDIHTNWITVDIGSAIPLDEIV